jgi:hypothetical protein
LTTAFASLTVPCPKFRRRRRRRRRNEIHVVTLAKRGGGGLFEKFYSSTLAALTQSFSILGGLRVKAAYRGKSFSSRLKCQE